MCVYVIMSDVLVGFLCRGCSSAARTLELAHAPACGAEDGLAVMESVPHEPGDQAGKTGGKEFFEMEKCMYARVV